MEQLQWRFLVFMMVCSTLSVTWNATGGACAKAPAPSPKSNPPPPPAQTPSDYYDPNEEVAINDILTFWNNSGTNVSALMPTWSSNNHTHPCKYTFATDQSSWILCSTTSVTIGNLTGNEHKLYSMNIVFGNEVGSLQIVGELPAAIRNLTNLTYLRMDRHPRLSGPLPPNIIKAFPSITSLSLTNSNLSGTVTVSPEPYKAIDELDLSGNFFTGTPFCQDQAANFTVHSLNFSTNQFSGTFCGDDTSTKLELLDISDNQFTGVNITITNQSNNVFPLRILYGQQNRLQTFPSDLLRLPRLEEIYFDSNNISGTLTFPYISTTSSLVRLISLTNNNITDLQPSTVSPSLFTAESLQISDLVFLGGNPICKDARKSDLLRIVCRFNKSSPIEDPYTKSSKIPTIIGACMGGIVVVVLMIALFFILKLRKSVKRMREIQNELEKKDVKPNLYSYTELRGATQDFHPSNELGRGGYGVVYKGELPDGSKVAVKKLLRANKEQDIQDFLNEIVIISKIKHRNLVRMKGCCIKEDQRILVYELVENKNLANMLWEDSNEDHIDWGTRFNIILGIARGMAYLHEEIEPPIIHRDIKGPNILLDKDLNPKISDFGLALLLPSLADGETHMNISRVAGTMGYIAPEYATYGQVSSKVDVFSFGVLVLEIVSGRRNIDPSFPIEQLCLTLWAQKMHARNETLGLVDKSLQDLTSNEEATITRVVEVGLLCLHHVATRRPSMSDIVGMLIGNKELDHVALHEYHQTYLQEDVDSTSSSLPSTQSWNLSLA